MSEVAYPLKPKKLANTTTPQDTFVDISHSLTESVLLYRPEDNVFIALYPDEWLSCKADADENHKAIAELQEANRAVTEKSFTLQELLRQPDSARADIDTARKDLDTALNVLDQKSEAAKKRVETLVDQKTDPEKIVELLPLTLKRSNKEYTPIYIKASKLKSALADKRFFFVDGAAERKKQPEERLFNSRLLNIKEARNRLVSSAQDRAKFEKKWNFKPEDAEAYSGILTDWAKAMGASATEFLEREQQEIMDGVFSSEIHDPNSPYRSIDVKPEAQFMRWTAGAGSSVNFKYFQGDLYDKRDKNIMSRLARAARSVQFGFKANAEASFAVGEAKVETTLYVPHAAGFHLDAAAEGRAYDFGYFRMKSTMTLSALAGASLALETNATLMVTGSKQSIKGARRIVAKSNVGAKGEAKLFAGLKEGVGLKGAIQWLNPEGMIDPAAVKKPIPTKAVAEYVDIANVDGDASLIQGLAATLGFQCDYRGGKFVVAAKAGMCLGLGGSGSVAAEVHFDQVKQFFLCIAHQLKQANYTELAGLMSLTTFKIYNKILYLAFVLKMDVEKLVGQAEDDIMSLYNDTLEAIKKKGEGFIRELESQMRGGWGWYAYMPPEPRGVLIQNVADAIMHVPLQDDTNLRQLAAFSVNEILSTMQTSSHLDNTLDRIGLSMGEVTGRSNGIQIIDSVVKGTVFSDCLSRTETQLASASPLMGRPFLRNDSGNFLMAKFSLDHAGYGVA